MTDERGQGVLATPARRVSWRSAATLGASLTVLAVVLWRVDARAVIDQLRTTDMAWLMFSMAVSLPQLASLGLRWAFISHRLNVPLPKDTAIGEYALAVALNLTLPTGIAGDALRAVRHRSALRATGNAHAGPGCVEAIVLDRISGQLALAPLALIALGLATAQGVLPSRVLLPLLVAAALLLAVAGLFRLSPLRHTPRLEPWRRALSRGRAVLFEPAAFAVHFGWSLLFLSCLLVQYWAAGRAVGVLFSFTQVLWFGCGVLVASSWPNFFGGWGVREAAGAGLFALGGLPASDGVAVSLTFGVFGLLVAWFGAGLSLISLLVRSRTPPTPR